MSTAPGFFLWSVETGSSPAAIGADSDNEKLTFGLSSPLVLISVVLLSSGCLSRPGSYPSREIKLIIQASPGGLSDTVSRVIASLMEQKLGAPVVCENKPGAAGALAFSYVSRQAPDGYTIGHGPVEIAMVRALGYARVGPDDMELLCLVSKTQPALAVHAGSRWRTFGDFAAAARARPGYYVVANSGAGSIWHINALLMERGSGIQVVHCPFSGSSGALTALLGRHVDAVVAGVGEVAPHIRAGGLRALAVFDRDRSPLLPDVPAVSEEGYEFGTSAWSGFFAPKGLPADRGRVLVQAIRFAFQSQEFQRVCRERGMQPVFLPPEEFRSFAGEQARFFSAMIPVLMGGGPG